MGADYIESSVPLCSMTDDRKKRVAEIIDQQPAPDPEKSRYDDDETEYRERLRAAMSVYCSPERRDIGVCDGEHYKIARTGGMSWGDSPTESMDHFDAINDCDPLWNQLEAWAIEDADSLLTVHCHLNKLNGAVDGLLKFFGDADYWDEHIDHTREDWRHEVNCDSTRLGYWHWVAKQVSEED